MLFFNYAGYPVESGHTGTVRSVCGDPAWIDGDVPQCTTGPEYTGKERPVSGTHLVSADCA